MRTTTPLNNRELAVVALAMFAVVVAGLWGMRVLWSGVERMDPWALAERECGGLAPNGIDSDERQACLRRVVHEESFSWIGMVGPGLLGLAGAAGVVGLAVARRRPTAEPSSG